MLHEIFSAIQTEILKYFLYTLCFRTILNDFIFCRSSLNFVDILGGTPQVNTVVRNRYRYSIVGKSERFFAILTHNS